MHARVSWPSLAPLRFVALPLWLGACSHGGADCLLPPCPLPVAVEVTVTDAASGAAVAGAFVSTAGMVGEPAPCRSSGAETLCDVRGGAGTYEIDVGAPGYRTVHRQVVVAGERAACGCSGVTTQRFSLGLVAGG